MRKTWHAGLLIATFALSGCGAAHGSAPSRGGSAAGSDTARAPASPLCTRLRARITGHVDDSAATELSRLVLSRTQPGVLWTHNDSGDRARVFAVSQGGAVLADLDVPGAQNIDWEDIALGHGAPGTGAAGGDALYLGDIGDNNAQRPDVVVYRTPEPQLAGGAPAATAAAQALVLRYPDGPRDAEALLVDRATGALVIVSKSFTGTAGIYVAARPRAGATTVLRRAGTLHLGPLEAVTAGDVSADGRTIALRTYDRAFVWRRARGAAIASTLTAGRPCTAGAGLFGEGQGEALALTADGRAFFTVPEGKRPALRRYAPAP